MIFNHLGRTLRGVICLYATYAFLGSSAFASCSSTLAGTTATVTCTAATDQIVVSQEIFFINTYWTHTGPSGTFNNNRFDWGGGLALAAGGTVQFASLGGGQLSIGDPTNTPADALNGTVGVTDTGGVSAQVTLDASTSTTGNTYTLDGSTGFTTVNALTYYDASSTGESLTISTGTAADTVNVLTSFTPDSLTIQGNNGADQVNVGNAGSLLGISSPVTIFNAGFYTAITIDDSADATARTATYTSTGVSGVAPASINWVANDISAVNLIMGTGSDTVNVQTISNPSGLVSLTIQGTNGFDQVNIGNAGSVQGIAAPVTVKNTFSFTALTIDDSADATGQTATVVSGAVTGIAPAAINWSPLDISIVQLNAGFGNDTVNVLATDTFAPVSIQGTDGFDQVNIGNAGSVQGILGTLTIANTVYFTNLLIDDSADATGRTAAYTSTGVSGVAPAAINWTVTDINGVVLNMGTGNDTVNVASTGGIQSLTIQGTDGNDNVNVGNAGSTQAILGSVDIRNTGFFTAVAVNDSLDATGREATYSASGVAGVAPAAITWVAGDVASTTVNFGSGSDLLHIIGSPPVSNVINLGNGGNRCFITGSGLGAASSNTVIAGGGDDAFTISAVPTNVTSITIVGGGQTFGDKLIYTSGTATGAFPINGTLVPTDPTAHSIDYNSIELFSINDNIFANGFE